MNLFFRNFILLGLMFSFFTNSVNGKVLSNKQVMGFSIATATGVALLSGIYWLMSSTENEDAFDGDNVGKDGETILQEKKQSRGARIKQMTADILKFMVLPSVAGIGAYWILNKYTCEGYLEFVTSKVSQVDSGLKKKISDGTSNLVQENLTPEKIEEIIKFNFGTDTHRPLIEAEKYLGEFQEILQEAVGGIETIKTEQLKNHDDEKFNSMQSRVTGLFEKITLALKTIRESKNYAAEREQYNLLEKCKIQKEDQSLQRKHELFKQLMWIGGAVTIAGKLVAPFS